MYSLGFVTGTSKKCIQKIFLWTQQIVETLNYTLYHCYTTNTLGINNASVLGGSDSIVNVWDLGKQYCTHNLRGSIGVVNVTRFHPDVSALKLFTCSVADCNIRVWDLNTSKSVTHLC